MPEKTVIDCYGHNYQSSRWMQKERPCQVATDASGNIYQRFDNADTCAIIKISESNSVISIFWTYGSWADRENLTYNKTPKQSIAIEVIA